MFKKLTLFSALLILAASTTFAQVPLGGVTANSINGGNKIEVSWTNPIMTARYVNWTVSINGPLVSRIEYTSNPSLDFDAQPGGYYTICVRGVAMLQSGSQMNISEACATVYTQPSSSGGGGNTDPCSPFFITTRLESHVAASLTLVWVKGPNGQLPLSSVMYARCRRKGTSDAWNTTYVSMQSMTCSWYDLPWGEYEVEYAGCANGSFSQVQQTMWTGE